MKKTNILKFALTLVMAFAISGAFAQILNDYEDVAETSYQTEGVAFRVYVEPDPIYSPSWVAATNANVSADARWTWDLGGLSAAAPWADNVTPIAQNYVEVTAPTTGSYTVQVVESSTLTGCADATAETQDVEVIAAPTADIAGGSGNNVWNVNTADHDYDICGDALAEDITVTITETGVSAALAEYAYYVQKRVVVIDNLGAEQGASEVTSAFIDNTIAARYATATANGGTQILTTGAMPILSYDWGSGATPSRTKYEFTIMKPSDAAAASANGIVSTVSYKSDYLAYEQDIATDGDNGASDEDITTYSFAAAEVAVTYIVNPTPVTGPIYTIPNAINL